jgi:hypothetical protein
MELLIGNDQTLTLEGLQDEVTSNYINDATVTATVKDRAGNAVSGQSWPLTLDYVTASDGIYRGNLEDTLVLAPGVSYFVEISAVAGAGKGFWRFARKAMERRP